MFQLDLQNSKLLLFEVQSLKLSNKLAFVFKNVKLTYRKNNTWCY